MDEEPGGNSDDPVVLENLKEKFRHSTIGELTGYYVLAEQQKKYISRFLSKLGIKNIQRIRSIRILTNNIVSEIKQTNRGFNMLFTARRAPMDFALVEDKSAYRRHQRFIWSTLDSLVRSRAIDDSIRTDVFLAVECRADVEGTLGGYPEVLLRYGFKLSWGSIDARKSFLEEIDTTMYTPQMCNLIWNEFGLYDKAIHFRNALLKKKFYKHVKYSRLNIPTNRKLQKHFRTYVTYIKQRDRTKKNMSDKDLQYFFMALPADIQTSFKSHCTKYCSAFRDFIIRQW